MFFQLALLEILARVGGGLVNLVDGDGTAHQAGDFPSLRIGIAAVWCFAQNIKTSLLPQSILSKDSENVEGGETVQIDRKAVWETYARAWKEKGREAKSAALYESVSPQSLYIDPLTVAVGHDNLIGYMLGFHQQVPGGYFVTKYFLAHHEVSIARWDMLTGDHVVIGEGISYATYGQDGKLTTMTGFFERPPWA